MAKAVNEGLVQLDPGVILAESNSRYGLKQLRIDSLKQSILEQGGVMQPVEVEPLDKPVDGKVYRLTAGFYRHAAVTDLNTSAGAGLTLPAMVRPLGDETLRLKRQLAENMERENQSPMDKAIAIKKLEDAGVSRAEIKKIFSTPGGRKGLVMQPASNSFVNMTLSFLDLPKSIQEKIHDGRVGVGAAYELTKVKPEDRAAVLEKAETARLKIIDNEEADEKKYLATEAKMQEAHAKEIEVAEKLKATEAQIEAAKAEKEAKAAAALEAYKLATAAKGEEKAKADEHLKAIEADSKAADKRLEGLNKEVTKLSAQSEKVSALAAQKAAQLANARKAKTAEGKKKPTTAAEVKKAAAEGDGPVQLTANEMRRTIKDLTAPGAFPKVREIAIAIQECFAGGITDRQLYTKLAVITGEKSTKAKKEVAA